MANIIILGDTAVGKSTLLEVYFEKIFTEVYLATLSLDFYYKKYTSEYDDQEMHFKFWDTAGSEY